MDRIQILDLATDEALTDEQLDAVTGGVDLTSDARFTVSRSFTQSSSYNAVAMVDPTC